MIETDLGWLKFGDTFWYKGEEYKAVSLGHWAINNVICVNLKTKKRIRLDVSTTVEV